MTAIDFPNSPTVGQLFTVGDITWEWTGTVWRSSTNQVIPTHAVTHEDGGADELELAPAQVTGTAVVDGDSRLTDARTPTAHATSHGSAGSDAITVAQSQVTDLSTDLGAKVEKTNGTVTTAAVASTVVRNITLSTSEPTGGMDGDVWLVYEA